MSSRENYQDALDIGNQRRLARAKIHRRVRDTSNFEASCIEVAKVLAEVPPLCLGSMRAEELLQWVWCRGGTAATKRRLIYDALEAAGCSEFRLVRELTDRQRERIVDVLTSYAYGRQAA
jgi:hypothetical protein